MGKWVGGNRGRIKRVWAIKSTPSILGGGEMKYKSSKIIKIYWEIKNNLIY